MSGPFNDQNKEEKNPEKNLCIHCICMPSYLYFALGLDIPKTEY